MMQLGSPHEENSPLWINPNAIYDPTAGNYKVYQDLGKPAPIANSEIPKNVTMVMPQYVQEAQQVAANPQPQLNPADLLKPLPSIVSTAPVALPETCGGVGDWLGKNPVMALGILGVLAFVVLGKGGNK